MENPHDPHGRRHRRGYLPHFDAPGFVQFVTFRLNGSLPRSIFETLKFKLASKQINEVQYHREMEMALDAGFGPTHLKIESIANLLVEAIKRFDGERYQLFAWVVMPNHVHLLIAPFDKFALEKIIHSIKSFTATQANQVLGTSGRFWSPDYFDRFIRNKTHFENARKYIEENPVKAHLCASANRWKWSSAYDGVD